MSNQLRSAARNLVGRPVEVRHNDGHVSRGVLRHISDRGVHLEPTNGARFAAAMKEKAGVETAIASESDEVCGEEVFFAWWLILWALIVGIAAWSWAGWGGYGPGVARGYGAGYGYPGLRRGIGRGLFW